jgi:hypothetical protein
LGSCCGALAGASGGCDAASALRPMRSAAASAAAAAACSSSWYAAAAAAAAADVAAVARWPAAPAGSSPLAAITTRAGGLVAARCARSASMSASV